MGVNLHCTVCDKVLESKESWNNHLVVDYHQEVAREETSNRWWSDEQLRNSSLVVFSSVPLSSQLCGEIISQFSKKVKVFVTDFVWWRERPKVALLQFESKKIAKEVVKRHGDTSVGGHRVQLKKAWSYLQLEFEELLGIPPILPELASIPDADVSICEVEVVQVEAPIPEVVDLDVTLSPARNTIQPSPPADSFSGGGTEAATLTTFINSWKPDYSWIQKKMGYRLKYLQKSQKQNQICRLIRYLCRFDSCLRGVLALLDFWAKRHDLQVTNAIGTEECQDPTIGLHLLVVVYFMNEKLLPSVQKLQPGRGGASFTEDYKFVDSWKGDHNRPPEGSPAWMESIVQLTRNCFQFYSQNLTSGRWMLSCYDGVVLNYDHFQIGSERPRIDAEERIYLAHPFDRMKQCAFDIEIWETRMCPTMEKTAKILTEYLSGDGKDLKLAKVLAADRTCHRKLQE